MMIIVNAEIGLLLAFVSADFGHRNPSATVGDGVRSDLRRLHLSSVHVLCQ